MTEEEAKTKWCPFVRVGSETTGLGSINRDVRKNDAFEGTRCIGSACMAWRWVEGMTDCVEIAAPKGHIDYGKTLTVSRSAAEKHNWPIVREVSDHGFCGLAGKP